MDALVAASFLLVGWNTYSAAVVAKDTYTGKMSGPKSVGYSIAGLAGLTAFMLYKYGAAAQKHPELLDAEEGRCALCNCSGKFQVEDLPVGPRWFCCEKCYAEYVGLPVKEEGYYGFEAEGSFERKYYARFGDERGGKEWGEYDFTWQIASSSSDEWTPIDEDTTGWDDDDLEEYRHEKEYELVNQMLEDSGSELYHAITREAIGDEMYVGTDYEVHDNEGNPTNLDFYISWDEPKNVEQKINYYNKEPLSQLQFLAEYTGDYYEPYGFCEWCKDDIQKEADGLRVRGELVCKGCKEAWDESEDVEGWWAESSDNKPYYEVMVDSSTLNNLNGEFDDGLRMELNNNLRGQVLSLDYGEGGDEPFMTPSEAKKDYMNQISITTHSYEPDADEITGEWYGEPNTNIWRGTINFPEGHRDWEGGEFYLRVFGFKESELPYESFQSQVKAEKKIMDYIQRTVEVYVRERDEEGNFHTVYHAEDREDTERMTRPEAEELVATVEKFVVPYTDRAEVCGSYRRGSPRPGDLDVVIIPKKGVTLPSIVEAGSTSGLISAVNWIGEKKTQVVIDGRKVDFRVSSPAGWGAALLYFTGPAGYNIGMRVRAKKQGMKLNEYGIFDRASGKYLGGATEDEIYKVLGKTPKVPAMRAEQVTSDSKCDYCNAAGETFVARTKGGSTRNFCGPICRYKYEGLAAEEKSWLGISLAGKVDEIEEMLGRKKEAESYDHEATMRKFVAWLKDNNLEASDVEGFTPEGKPLLKPLSQRANYKGIKITNKRELNAENQTFEAPRATYSNQLQQDFEKSYNIRAKKPLNKIVKNNLDGSLPSDDSRKWRRSTYNLSNMTKDDVKLIQGYFTIQRMANARFGTTNQVWVQDANEYAAISSQNIMDKSIKATPYLAKAIKHYYAMANLSDADMVTYIKDKIGKHHGHIFDEMLQVLRYYDIMNGAYAGINMVGTDRAPYSTEGGYGNVYYNRRNPYEDNNLSLKDFGIYDSKAGTFAGQTRRAGGVFTRLTKLRPYTMLLPVTTNQDASIEYCTDGGYGWRSSGSQCFHLQPMVCVEYAKNGQRNPDPGWYSNTGLYGWRYNIEGWEGVKSAPYRYSTLVHLPSPDKLMAIHSGKSALPRSELIRIYNKAKGLNKEAIDLVQKEKEAREQKEMRERALRKKTQAITNLGTLKGKITVLIQEQVKVARDSGVSEDDIYDSLENTLYDIEELIEDWEPSDYMAAEGEYGCKECGTGPHPTIIANEKVFVACPQCGLVAGSEDSIEWSVQWDKDTPPALADRPFGDVEWDDTDTNSEE